MDYISVLQSGTSRKLIDSIVDDVFSTPENLSVIFELIFHDDIKIAWKAAWAIEKIVRKYPKFIICSLLKNKSCRKTDELMLT